MVQTSIYRCSDIIKQSIVGKLESRPHKFFLTDFLYRHCYSVLILHLVDRCVTLQKSKNENRVSTENELAYNVNQKPSHLVGDGV